MQQRRREKIGTIPSATWPDSSPQFWKNLTDENPQYICANTGATHVGNGVYQIRCLNETWSLDTAQQQVMKTDGDFGGEWDRQIPFLLLVYMAMAKREPVSDVMIAPRDVLSGKNFFEGRYELHTKDLIHAFGEKKEGFLQAAKRIGGVPRDEADVSARFHVFPKFIVDYLIWLSDDEFPASVTILFNKNLPIHYPLDATAVLINLLSHRLIFVEEQY